MYGWSAELMKHKTLAIMSCIDHKKEVCLTVWIIEQNR